MKILKFSEFKLNESSVMHDTPKDYIHTVLAKLKSRLDLLFLQDKKDLDKEPKDKIKKMKEMDKSNEMTLKDMGVRLESSEINKSTLYDSLKIKFSDGNGIYDLNVTINFEDAIPKEGEAFTSDDIKKCFIKFKKYNEDTFDLVGEITKNANLKDIDENMIIKLKVEVEAEGADEEKEVSIELKKD